MGRTPCCVKVGLKKGSWTSEEDHKLVSYIEQHGHGGWSGLPSKAGLQRCGKSCRLRWMNYLRPDIKRGKFNADEEQTITRLHALLGNRWSAIANHLPQRTDNEIKNYWNTHVKKRLIKMGIDPISHRRKAADFGINIANLSHMTQWENARLEAESRLMRDARKLVSGPNKFIQNKISPHQLIHKPNHLSRLIPPQPLCLDVIKAWQGIMSPSFSNRVTLESPVSTLDFSSNSPTVPNVRLLDNQGMSMVNYVASMFDDGVITEHNIQNNSENAESSLVLQTIQEKMENSNGLHEMLYPNGIPAIQVDYTTELIDVANAYNNLSTKSNNIDMDLEVNWNNLLYNLANSNASSLDSISFLN